MRLHFWNLMLSLFFVFLVVVSISWLANAGRIFYDISVRDLVLMTLAIYRLIRLFTYDLITQFVRDWFVGASEGSLRYTLGQLINCPWCTGLWFSWFIVTFYFASIYSWPIILLLALAAGGSFIQILSNWVGWSAEEKKLQARALGK